MRARRIWLGWRVGAMVCAIAMAPLGAAAAPGQANPERRPIDIPAGPLSEALRRYSAQTGQAVLCDPNLIRDLSTQGLHGRYAPEEALRRLIGDFHLYDRRTPDGVILIYRNTSGPVAPQPAPPESLTKKPPDARPTLVTVTGLRAALSGALRAKRRSNAQIDEIHAEDIAEFPDSNLAESLQRLTGVSIDRVNGEGDTITVRGLSGEFNRTTIDGLEALATTGGLMSGDTPNRTRAFNYSVFPSEMFQALSLQKTPSAADDEGSIGATIHLRLIKPFDLDTDKLSLRLADQVSANSARQTPRLSLLAARLWDDKKMGVVFAAAYNRSDNQLDKYIRSPGPADYLYRGSDFAGLENPPRAGFAAPAGTDFTVISDDGAQNLVSNAAAYTALTGSDANAYAQLYPGAPYSTPGRYDDSTVRIPALPTYGRQDVASERLSLSSSFQMKPDADTRVSLDALYARYRNISTIRNIVPVGLNRDYTNAALNTAGDGLSGAEARALYPNLCIASAGNTDPNLAGKAVAPPQDCGQQLYGDTPAFATGFDGQPAVLGVNIFSVNPDNLDPFDYYNNPSSPGYIASADHLAQRVAMIGRPATKVLASHLTNGLVDYLKLANVDFRSSADRADYTTRFDQESLDIERRLSDRWSARLRLGGSQSVNLTHGLLVEFNALDAPGVFTYDARGKASVPILDFGFDIADPANWSVVKGYSQFGVRVSYVRNAYHAAKLDFVYKASSRWRWRFGAARRDYAFSTWIAERNNVYVNPTLTEAGVTTTQMSDRVNFGSGLPVTGGATQFVSPNLDRFDALFGLTCNCVNRWGDWRLTTLRLGGVNTYTVQERDTIGYVQGDFALRLFGRPLSGNAGVRYAGTDLRSTGKTPQGRLTYGAHAYGDWLPALNLNWRVRDDLILRLAASKAMARPQLANLAPTVTAISIPSDGVTSGATVSVGNPRVDPFRSNNIDMAAEWYFAPHSLASIALFDKEVASFPQLVAYTAALSQTLDPETLAALRLQYVNINQLAYIDHDFDVTVRQYRDAPGGYLRGLEAGLQGEFRFLPGWLKNLGGQLNYTHVASRLTYILSPGAPATTSRAARPAVYGRAPWLNVSPDATNAALWYETPRLRIRLAASYRKGYATTYPLYAGACSPGQVAGDLAAEPAPSGSLTPCASPLINDFAYSRATLNIDASASYRFTSHLSAQVEALNLSDQTSDRYAYSGQAATTAWVDPGRVFRVAVRYVY